MYITETICTLANDSLSLSLNEEKPGKSSSLPTEVSSYFPLPFFLTDEDCFPSVLGGLPLRPGVWLPPFNFLEEGDGLGLLGTGRDVKISKASI